MAHVLGLWGSWASWLSCWAAGRAAGVPCNGDTLEPGITENGKKGPSSALLVQLPLASRVFKIVREMSQHLRMSLFDRDGHVLLLCFISSVRHDGEKS